MVNTSLTGHWSQKMVFGSIPFIDFGGSGPSLHFLHANGYPPACYTPLLRQLTFTFHTFRMLLRPLWPDSNPADISDWLPFSDDLLQFLEDRQTGSVIGVGHSIGAIVTLRAALREPRQFRALVLLDPVLFPPWIMLERSLARILGGGSRSHPLIQAAMKRRRDFNDLIQVFTGYRRRDVFRFFSDEHLRVLIDGMTRPKSEGGYELAFSPEWEARIYYTGIWRDWDLWRGIAKLKIPTLLIRGAETDTFLESTARAFSKRNHKLQFVTLADSAHLVPLERPDEVLNIMLSFLKEVLWWT